MSADDEPSVPLPSLRRALNEPDAELGGLRRQLIALGDCPADPDVRRSAYPERLRSILETLAEGEAELLQRLERQLASGADQLAQTQALLEAARDDAQQSRNSLARTQ